MPKEPDPDLRVQKILLAASQHNLEARHTFLQYSSADMRDSETDQTPLHSHCSFQPEDGVAPVDTQIEMNGHVNEIVNDKDTTGDVKAPEVDKETEAAKKTLKLLLPQSGAIWNNLDKNKEMVIMIVSVFLQSSSYHLLVFSYTF